MSGSSGTGISPGGSGGPPTPSDTADSGTTTTSQPPAQPPPAPAPVSPWTVVGPKLQHWFFFGVLFGVLPIALCFAMNSLSRNGMTLTQLLGRGELLIVTTSLAAAAAGQIITRKGSPAGITNVLGFLVCLNILLAVATAGLFAFVSYASQTPQSIDATSVAQYSVVLFASSVVTAGSSALIVEWEQAQ
ncbi:hypothetical protein [Streptomyces sp. NRRL S-87]|uniref:hypothetical protein n=1 Tax=Streptomyces sp. NRRL S-87 TaxID=1463920 RepID=UPI0004C0B6FD|nr:hypothetical protein [Streptomyces sp. NRRL S-87]